MHPVRDSRVPSRRICFATTLLIMCFATFVVFPSAARAGGGGHCAVWIPSCTVGVGGGGTGGGGGGGGGTGGGSITSPGCHNTDPRGNGCDPCNTSTTQIPVDRNACQIYSHNLFCSELNPRGLSYQEWESELKGFGCTGNQYNPGSPAVAAQEAFATITFPTPSGSRSPRPSLIYQGYPFTYVNLFTFYWTSPGTWKTLTATATDKDQSATVTATPVELDFAPGDGGSPVACDGPGRPWVQTDGNGAPTDGACAYRYSKVTAGPITSTQTIVWQITWKGTGGSSGEIPSLSTSTSGQLQVLQVQVVTR